MILNYILLCCAVLFANAARRRPGFYIVLYDFGCLKIDPGPLGPGGSVRIGGGSGGGAPGLGGGSGRGGSRVRGPRRRWVACWCGVHECRRGGAWVHLENVWGVVWVQLETSLEPV